MSSSNQSGASPAARPDLARFGEDVLVLPVAHDEGALAASLDSDELEVARGRLDGDEGDRAVVVLPRRHLAEPFADVEDHPGAVALDRHLAQRGVAVARGQLARLC